MSSSSTTEEPPDEPAEDPKEEVQLPAPPVPTHTIQQRLAHLVSAGSFRAAVVIGAMFLVLAGPFWLRPEESELFTSADETLIILSPHNDSIRTEFSRAFGLHMRETADRKVRIDWRDIGGTSEISRYIDGSFKAAFERFWHKTRREAGRPRWKGPGGPGHAALSREVPDDTPSDDTQVEATRRLFLESDVGIGADLFFGGGAYPFIQHGRRGHLVDSGIFDEEPEWFTDAVIPQSASGEPLFDPNHIWVGNCLSSFGICYNEDWIKRLGIEPPDQWEDLGDPAYFGTIAVADPTKSSSATKAFEMLIQQQLAISMDAIDPDLVVNMQDARDNALDEGWTRALNIIQQISANSRYFTDSATKIPFDVAQGGASAGMCIDFYGRTLNEYLRKDDGLSRIHFVVPAGGTSIGADPIAMFRGAPHPDLSREFIRFLLSPKGQRLWHYRVGTEDGPTKNALRRLPIRKDAYTPEELAQSSDPDVFPYERAEEFFYHADWTGPHFGVIRFIIQVMCLETHHELMEAWEALIEADFPPRATNIFYNVQFVGYTNVTGELSEKLRSGDPLTIQKRRRDLRESFRKNYVLAAEIARRGE